VAYDGGDPPRSATLHVAIVVGDVNDHSPRFIHGDLFNVTLPEDFPLAVPFLQVSTDRSHFSSFIVARYMDCHHTVERPELTVT